ncbi:ferric-dicitrate binding protein FerR (iron transport regulator) [Rhabdobacter roseus]|uniref:Ferric-dicitrate binding protein FerR (Iron transport regulator) n=2 Tax=Rhabdobacter roseus TaxID=1655419 RepID=A0A840TPE7_9BACT|nr:ferric-dicitrate binding protein FerR (iron transport regulator) [Rhabdobacter roseus]
MYQHYASYESADFVGDEYFIQWVKHPNSQSDQFWHEFQEVFPHQKATIEQARQRVLLLGEASVPPIQQDEAREIWDSIDRQLASSLEERRRTLPPGTWLPWAAAASVVLLVGLGWWLSGTKLPKSASTYHGLVELAAQEHPLEEVINNTSSSFTLRLPDESTVILEKNSRLSYVKSFEGANREVFLTGSAFFEVAKDAGKPFLVYSHGLVTKVLGTSFHISALEKEREVRVSVKTGRVSVYANKSSRTPDPETAGLVLSPNQQVLFLRDEERFNRTLIEIPQVLLSQHELEKFAFEDAPVAEIFEALEKVYGIEVVFDAEALAPCHLTTTLAVETLFDKLEVICESIGASYKVVDAQVIISSKGC